MGRFDEAIARNERIAEEAGSAVKDAIMRLDLKGARDQHSLERSARATVARLKARRDKEESDK